MYVCELTDALGISQPTLSHHIRKLENAWFVRSERRGSEFITVWLKTLCWVVCLFNDLNIVINTTGIEVEQHRYTSDP